MIPIFEAKVKHNCDNFNYSNITCPKCACVGHFNSHGYYKRNKIVFHFKKVLYETVKVKRLKCKSCTTTHALIDDSLVPHKQYSLSFIFAVLKDRLINKLTVGEICAKYHISSQLFYAWLKQFKSGSLLISSLMGLGSKCFIKIIKSIINITLPTAFSTPWRYVEPPK